jgi:methyl-accepting chemotaxis protein
VNQIDQVTQQNAAMAEEATAASHALAQEATDLNGLLGRFQLAHAGPPQPHRNARVPNLERAALAS